MKTTIGLRTEMARLFAVARDWRVRAAPVSRTAAKAAMLGLVAWLALGDGARADEGETTALRGRRPDAKGRLVLPVSGLEVDVPKADRKATEVWGRVSPAAGLEAPGLGDEVALEAAEGFAALSVAIDTPGCSGFETLEGVATIRVGRDTWLELAQGAIDPAAPDGLAGWVLCGPGVRVHLVTTVAARPAIGKRWLPVLAAARKRPVMWRDGDDTYAAVLVEAPHTEGTEGTEGEVAPWPAKIELVSKAADRLFETRLALVRREAEPTEGAVLARDRYQWLIPAAWQAEILVERLLAVPCPAATPMKIALPDGWTAHTAKGGIGACRSLAENETLVVNLRGEADPKRLAPALTAFIGALDAAKPTP